MPSRPARTAVPRVESIMLRLLSTRRPQRGVPAGCTACLPGRPRRQMRASDRSAMLSTMDVPHGFDPTLILVLNLAGTFVFGLSGGLAAVRARLDLFGVVVLAAVVALAGGITRDVLIGTPPASFRDWRYLAAAAAAGLVCFFAGRTLERAERSVMLPDALGLGLFAVTGATKALQFGLGPLQAVLLGTITGVGGGMLRDVLLRQGAAGL